MVTASKWRPDFYFKYCAPKKQLSHYSFSIITITGHRQEKIVAAYDSENYCGPEGSDITHKEVAC